MNRDLARTEASALYSAARGRIWLNVFWENKSRNGASGPSNASEAAIIPWDQSPRSAAAPPVGAPVRPVAGPVGGSAAPDRPDGVPVRPVVGPAVGQVVPVRRVAEPVLHPLPVPQTFEIADRLACKSPVRRPRDQSGYPAIG